MSTGRDAAESEEVDEVQPLVPPDPVRALGNRVRNQPRRVVARWLAIPFVIAVFAINSLGGPTHGSVVRSPATDAEIADFVAGQFRDVGVPGGAVAIVRDGRVSTSTGFGVADSTGRPVTATTPFVIGSVSKPITATAVLQLVDAGRVDLDAPVRRYLPEFGLADPAASATITMSELLDQTSGIPTSAGERPLTGPVTDLEQQVRALATVSPSTRPGTAYAYSNANYLVLGLVIERVSGEPYARYVDEHVFGPLGMVHAHADRAAAVADGLTAAHRFWFGLPREVTPLDRPDLAPAGFLTASASDLGRFAAANVNGGTLDGHRILSAASLAAMQHGVAPMGLGDGGSYGLGWADTTISGIRIVGHVGSTTDMASAVFFSPEQRAGIVVLLNGQSPLYELAHKTDLIGIAAFELLVGREPDGTIAFLYPAFDALAVLLLGWVAWRLMRIVRRLVAGQPVAPSLLGSTLLGAVVAVWLNAIIPAELLIIVPGLLAAPWTTLVRIDIGQVAFVFALLRLATGLVLALAAVRAVRAWREARRALPVVG